MDHSPPHPHHDVSTLAGPSSNPSSSAHSHSHAHSHSPSVSSVPVPVVPRDASTAPASPRLKRKVPGGTGSAAGATNAVAVLVEEEAPPSVPSATPSGTPSVGLGVGVGEMERDGSISASAECISFGAGERGERLCRAMAGRQGMMVVPGSLRERKEAAARLQKGQDRRRRGLVNVSATGETGNGVVEPEKREVVVNEEETAGGRKRRRVDIGMLDLVHYARVDNAMLGRKPVDEMVLDDDLFLASSSNPSLGNGPTPTTVRKSIPPRRLLNPPVVPKHIHDMVGSAPAAAALTHAAKSLKSPLPRLPRRGRRRAVSLPLSLSLNPFALSPRRKGKGKRATEVLGARGVGSTGQGSGLSPYKMVDFALPVMPPTKQLRPNSLASLASSSLTPLSTMGATSSSSTRLTLSSSQTLEPELAPQQSTSEQDSHSSSHVPPYVEIHDPGSSSPPTQVPVTAAAPPHVQIMTRHAVDLPREPIFAMPLSGSSSPVATIHGAQMVRIPGVWGPGMKGPVAVVPTGSTSAAGRGEGPSSPGQRMVVSPLIHVPAWQPPITKASMAELELTEVLKNAQLRHDVVFDDGLRFRPNLDGDRGERKRLVADRYWIAVEQEIVSGCRCTAFIHLPASAKPSRAAQLRGLNCVCEGGLASSIVDHCKPGLLPLSRIPSRLTGLVVELRNILLSLLPPSPPPTAGPLPSESLRETPTRTHDLINTVLDPETVTADLEDGRLDLASLAEFLGLILKNHCAPMRDMLVDNMIALISNQQAEYTVEADSTNTINLEGLLGRRYVGLTGGLRLCFEVLELMKLDIANHQLRTLRPLLLESAVDFEIKQFKDLLRRKPGLERTKRWYLRAAERLSVPPGITPYEDIFSIVREGLVELVFDVDPSTMAAAETPKSATRPSSQSKKFDLSPSPAPAVVPETFHMDTVRMQNMHSDLTDITIAYLLLMLFQQLAGHANLREGDVDTMKAEIWTFMSDSVLKARGTNAKGRPGPGMKKLEIPEWRAAMKDVLLQVAARAEAIKERGTADELPPLRAPSPAIISMMNSWMDNNLRAPAKLFTLARSRLRQSLNAVLADQVQSQMGYHMKPYSGVPSQLRTGRATSAAHVQEIANTRARRTKSGSSSSVTFVPPIRTRKRSLVERQEDSGEHSRDEGGEKRTRVDGLDRPIRRPASPTRSEIEEQEERARARQESRVAVEAILTRNGLTHLAPEIRVITIRMGKLLGFHLRAFRDLYRALHIPDPAAQSTLTSAPSNLILEDD